MEGDFPSSYSGADFTSWYRRLNYNYPFLDYGRAESHEADAALMVAYAEAEASPPPGTPRTGERLALPDGQLSTRPDVPAPFSFALLGAWLRLAGGIRSRRPGRQGPIVHKTSPSGGARHPTDIAVLLPPGWLNDRPFWWYDPDQHALVADETPLPVTVDLPSGVCAFLITSHVARAMWRYRDVRAFRPVLIDAGHVIETLTLVCAASGWYSSWVPCPAFHLDEGLDPILGVVVVSSRAMQVPVQVTRLGAPSNRGEQLRTNPVLSLMPAGSGIAAREHLNGGTVDAISSAAIAALAYAIPSSRGDRPSRPREIMGRTGVSGSDLELLVREGLLLDATSGDLLWAAATAWMTHDWYFSLLLHGEATQGISTFIASTKEPLRWWPWSRLSVALELRRTCRDFVPGRLAEDRLCLLMRAASESQVGVLVSVVVPQKALDRGTYQVSPSGGLVKLAAQPPSDQLIQRAAIGQPWVEGFSLAFWLLPGADGDTAAAWEQSLIACGQLAQRMALLLSDDPAIGVFQSPAVVDELLAEVLGRSAPTDGVYMVGVGPAGRGNGGR